MKSFLLPLAIPLMLLTAYVNSHPEKPQKSTTLTTISGKELSIDSLDKFLIHTMDSLEIPGLSIAIINDNRIVYHRALGVTDLERGTPMTDHTIFEAASLSKPLFAYFVMKMVEEGVLDLDEPYYPYLESIMPENIYEMVDSTSLEFYKSITPRMTLSHATGIPNWMHGKPIQVQFKPGTGFSYSGEAYQHLGAALGLRLVDSWDYRLDSIIQQKVCLPLGMKNSFYVWNDQLEEYKANGHKQGTVNREIHRDKKVGPGYSLHSEAHDYALFLMEMMEPKNLGQEYIDEMLREQNKFKADNELLQYGQTGWGLGFARRPTEYGMRYMHTGNNHDFQSYCAFYPEKKYGLVFFMNCDRIEPFFDVLGQIMDDRF